jgi:hypothetical protein
MAAGLGSGAGNRAGEGPGRHVSGGSGWPGANQTYGCWELTDTTSPVMYEA